MGSALFSTLFVQPREKYGMMKNSKECKEKKCEYHNRRKYFEEFWDEEAF